MQNAMQTIVSKKSMNETYILMESVSSLNPYASTFSVEANIDITVRSSDIRSLS